MAEVDLGAFRADPGYGRTRDSGSRSAMRAQPAVQGHGEFAGNDRGDLGNTNGGQGRVQRIVNAAGALMSVALVVGLAVWGYRLAVRDVTGVPVIRALEGPARVAPENPGGELARHQGLAVNTVAAAGEAAPPPDTLVLAPRPVDLTETDLPMGELASSAVVPGADPVDPVLAALAPPADATLTTPLDLIANDVPGLAISPRPIARPSGDVEAEAAVAAVMAALAPEPDLDIDPTTLVAGTRLVQLGTYPTEAEARTGWDQIVAAFGPLMDGKRRVIEEAESNGEAFFRLRAEGFADIADARRFCAVLEDQSATCVPAQVR